MQLLMEEQLLDQDFRAAIIEDILSDENQARKADMKKRYDILRDGTKKYVMEQMEKELSYETFEEAKTRASNISLYRKIVDKKAMVYKSGVKRKAEDDVQQEFIDTYTDKLNHNTNMKKVNRFLEAFKNCIYLVLPYQCPMTGKTKIRPRVLPPHLYDIIEDAENPEIPRVLILNYQARPETVMSTEPGQSGKRTERGRQDVSFRAGDGKDQVIADSPVDGNDSQEFIFWSNSFHFTCNKKGEIIPGRQEEDLRNPIGMLNFVNFAKDQDGHFWALGGDDLIEGSVLTNVLLTDMHFIAKMQGMGIFYLVGKNVPKNVKIGPSDAIIMERGEDEPDVQIGFASSNPPLDSHMKMIEQYVALLLSTNNLEPGTVKGELSATSANSGIQEMIRKSENLDDIEDQREIYRDMEPMIFEIIRRWHNVLVERQAAHPTMTKLGQINELEMKLEFVDKGNFISEKEKLEVLEKRKELGLDTYIDMIMRDNPDLSKDDAEIKLLELTEEKLKKQREKLLMVVNGQESNEENSTGESGPLEGPR